MNKRGGGGISICCFNWKYSSIGCGKREEIKKKTNMPILRSFVSCWCIRNRWQLTWQSYKHPWLMCYVYTKSSEFCHRRCTLPYLPTLEQHWTADSLSNVPAVHCIMKAISQDFTFQEESSIPTNIFFFLGGFQFLFTSPSAGVTHCYKHRCWRVEVILSILKRNRSPASLALAGLQQLLQWLATEPGKWDNCEKGADVI